MNYIYDIHLNLNETLYDFFDWNKSDKIIHIKKIPIIKIDYDSLKKIVKSKIQIDIEILNQIYNKTDLWNTKKSILYAILFTDGHDFISVEFDSKGNSIKKSYIPVDEELEITEIVNKYKEKSINFTIKSNEKNILKTRKQIQEEKFIYKELKNIDENKLNYIYFECFGKQEKNKQTILNNIKNISKSSKIYKNLYDILKLTANK